MIELAEDNDQAGEIEPAPNCAYGLSDDGLVFILRALKLEHRLRAGELQLLTRLSMTVRQQMEPRLPDSLHATTDLDVYTADFYEFRDHADSGTVQVALRIPGLGFAIAQIHPEDCNVLAAQLQRTAPANSPMRH